MNVTLKNGKLGTVEINKDRAKAVVIVDGAERVVAFVRDAKYIVVKNDLLLNNVDLNNVKTELSKFVKKAEDSRKRK